FANGYFYYQDGTVAPSGMPQGTKIRRMPYVAGQRTATGGLGELVADITYYNSALHWPKTLDMADDGTIYVGNGGDQSESCVFPHPFRGGVLKIDPAPGGANMGGVQLVKGLRNAINVRCRKGNNTCFAVELAKDYTAGMGGREKLLPIRAGDD